MSLSWVPSGVTRVQVRGQVSWGQTLSCPLWRWKRGREPRRGSGSGSWNQQEVGRAPDSRLLTSGMMEGSGLSSATGLVAPALGCGCGLRGLGRSPGGGLSLAAVTFALDPVLPSSTLWGRPARPSLPAWLW